MLSFPHLVVLFVIALIIFGPQKLPELARMLGKATAEFRKMTSDFRYALEDEVRELERQTRIREEEAAAAARAAQPAPAAPAGVFPRDTPVTTGSPSEIEPLKAVENQSHANPEPSLPPVPDAVTVPQEKSSDDNSAV